VPKVLGDVETIEPIFLLFLGEGGESGSTMAIFWAAGVEKRWERRYGVDSLEYEVEYLERNETNSEL